MSNPFMINPYKAYENDASMHVNSTQIGGSHAGGVWGNPDSKGVTGPGGAQKTGGNFHKEINDVALIGAQKKEGFMNGLGGAPTPPEGVGENLWTFI